MPEPISSARVSRADRKASDNVTGAKSAPSTFIRCFLNTVNHVRFEAFSNLRNPCVPPPVFISVDSLFQLRFFGIPSFLLCCFLDASLFCCMSHTSSLFHSLYSSTATLLFLSPALSSCSFHSVSWSLIFVIMVSGYKNLPQTFPALACARSRLGSMRAKIFDADEWGALERDLPISRPRSVQFSAMENMTSSQRQPTRIANRSFSQCIHPSTPNLYQPVTMSIAFSPKVVGEPLSQGVGNAALSRTLSIAPFFRVIVGVVNSLKAGAARGGSGGNTSGRGTLLFYCHGCVSTSRIALKGSTCWLGILKPSSRVTSLARRFCCGAKFRLSALAPWFTGHAILSMVLALGGPIFQR